MIAKTNPDVIPISRIRRWGACTEHVTRIAALYPDGVPLTREAAFALQDAGVDVLWGLLRLMTKQERVEFALFTLRQRQPHLASLLRQADCEAHALAIEALRFDTPEDAGEAVPVLDAARGAAGAAVWVAVGDAARCAVWVAAGAAARDAAGVAARNAAGREQIDWCCERILARTPGKAARGE